MSTDGDDLGAEIERIWREAGPLPKEAVEAFIAEFRRWLQAPSFQAGLPHLLLRSAEATARMEATAGEILRTYTPERFAAFMNRIRPKQYVRCEMSVQRAEQLLGSLTASKLADMIDTALDMTPTKLTWDKRLDALWRVEVDGPKTGMRLADHTVRTAQETRKLLGQSQPPGRPKGSRGWRGRIKTLATNLLAGPPERLGDVMSHLRLAQTASALTAAQLAARIRKALERKWPREDDRTRALADIWRIGAS
jgi:hypothetical protein